MRTAMLMALMGALMVMVGKALGGNQGAGIFLMISLAMNIYFYWCSDSMVLRQYNAKELTESSAPGLYKMVQRLANNAKIPMPKLYLINTDVPNAFATGRNPEHAAVAVNRGLADMLTMDELEGVLAHEISHIKHRDILISTVAGCMATVISYLAQVAQWAMIFGGGRRDDDDNGGVLGSIFAIIIAPIAASLIQMAISRSREYEADRSGGEISGKPDALADALLKIENYAQHRIMPNASETTAHMFIINPFSAKKLKSMFSTHPSTEERVKLLREQARKMGRL